MTTKNKKRQTEAEVRKLKVKHILSEEVPTVYINHAQIGFSIYDASMLLGEIKGVDRTDNTLNIVPRVNIMMSHGFLKAFADLINQNLAAFDKDEDINPLANLETHLEDAE
jgi:basic membrane lipoprotein Med (substrate-binding protein (PBP1-ABC) superfamily)